MLMNGMHAAFAHLPTFVAVAETGSFTGAARQLHVNQGAVSQRIRVLESTLGVQLFERSTRRVQLTPAGEILNRASVEALERVSGGLVEMYALGKEAQVTVSCSPSFAIRWLVPHMAALREVAPDLNLHIAADDRLVAPGPGSVDVCIRYGAGGYAGRVQQICAEVLRPVCSPLYLQHHPVKSAEDLLNHVLLHDDALADHPKHLGWREWFAHLGLPNLGDRGLRFSHSHMALNAAAAGQGIALGRTTLIQHDLDAGILVLPFEDVALRSALTYWLITPAGRRLTPAVEQFRDWLLPAVEREYAAHDSHAIPLDHRA